ncbi:MAG TPA: ACP S-malonyltransferase [bacterium]
MTIAFVFPGQGAQHAGMGKALAAASPPARQVFARADAALGFALSALCWEGPEETLRQTENTQPAILATSVACLAALQAHGVAPSLVAGLSVGEYAALVCVQALRLEDALNVVRRRGVLMQEAAAGRQTAMAAILGLGAPAVLKVCHDAASRGVVEPSNFNSPDQIVIAGDADAVHEAIRLAKAAGAKRAVLLPVSAPFHTSLMRSASVQLAEVLAAVPISAPIIPVVSNVTAQPIRQPTEIRRRLVEQVASPVRWDASVSAMAAAGVDTFVEIGPGTTLSGLIRKTVPSARVTNVNDPASLQAAVKLLQPVAQGTGNG